MTEHVAVIRVYCIPRGINIEELIAHSFQSGPNITLPMIPANMPNENHISIPTQDLHFHAVNHLNNPIPQATIERHIFEIARQVGNSVTGDIDVFVFGIPN